MTKDKPPTLHGFAPIMLDNIVVPRPHRLCSDGTREVVYTKLSIPDSEMCAPPPPPPPLFLKPVGDMLIDLD